MNKIAIVILNWNGEKYLEKFLPSVLKYSSIPGSEIVIADNGSTDGSVPFLKEHYPSLGLLVFDKNYGFASGYNKALNEIEADYFILLNSDVEVTENWIMPMVELLENNSDVAACMPKIRSLVRKEFFEYAGAAGGFIDRFGYAFCRGRLFNFLERDEGQYDQPVNVFWATGACLCIKSGAFKKSGGFDERFFAHMEEIDLCWRLQNAGFRIMMCPQSLVFHLGGGALPSENPYKVFLNFRNNLLMLFKNLKCSELLLKFPIRIMLDWISVLKFLFSLKIGHAFAVIRAHLLVFILLPTYINLRKGVTTRKSFSQLRGVFRGSIVWNFFVLQRKRYSDLRNSLTG